MEEEIKTQVEKIKDLSEEIGSETLNEILNSWHVPTNVIAFQKQLLDNRGKQVGYHLEL